MTKTDIRSDIKLGVVAEETWSFFNEIYKDLVDVHQTSLYKRPHVNPPILRERLNRFLLRRSLNRFFASNDVVFFEWASDLLVAASQARQPCAIATRLHRYEMYKWAKHVRWENVDHVILVSKAKEREFLARFPIMNGRTSVITEAVSTEKFLPSDRNFQGTIGTLCHLTPRKRVYDLILAFYELKKLGFDLKLRIGGGEHVANGDYYAAIRHLIDSLGLSSEIVLDGHVEKTGAWYKQVDIFVSHSYSEGLQVAPMEAMASGCYTLAHRWDGADELLPETNLYYSNEELCSRIRSFCELEKAEKLAERKRMREIVCERFDIEHAKVQIRQVIEDVFAANTR